MWLKNYDTIKIYSSVAAVKLNGGFSETQRPLIRNRDGSYTRLAASTSGDTARYATMLNNNWTTNYQTSVSNNQITIDIGGSDMAVKYDDYCLASPFDTSKVTKTIVDVGKPKLNLKDGKYTQTVAMDFKNITSEDIIVKEWGVFTCPQGLKCFMIRREVLAEADWVTVPAKTYCRINFEYDVVFSENMKNWNNGDTITDTWDEIVANANAGTVDDYNVGDTKTLEFTYDGTKYYVPMRIVGKNHDTISGTSNKAALTFLCNGLPFYHKMNDTNTNVGGWMGVDGDFYDVSQDMTDGVLTHGSEMRKFVCGLLDGLPASLQAAIKTVDKNYDAAGVIRKAKDKLWIPCLEEIKGTASYNVAGQGNLYEYFTADNETRKMIGNESFDSWWLRSRYASGSYYFWCVSGDGSTYYDSANNSYGVCFGFCV